VRAIDQAAQVHSATSLGGRAKATDISRLLVCRRGEGNPINGVTGLEERFHYATDGAVNPLPIFDSAFS
jgi:hypothetical protein